MRITNNMMVGTLLANLERNMNRMSVYQDQLATGKRVIRASDDPVGTSKILKFKSDIAALGQYEKNTGDSLAWLEVTESSVADTSDVLQRMHELAVQAANGTNTAEETQKISMEIQQIKEHLINNGNFSYAGRYAFSGYQTDIPLFNSDGTYRIDVTDADIANKAQLQYQVSIGQDMDVSTNGLDVFGVHLPAGPYILESNLPSGVNGTSINGVASTKSYLKGAFSLNIDYTADTLDITVNGVTYDVDELTMDGSTTPLTQNSVLDHFNNAVNGAAKLSDVADVFFDASGELIIKSKNYGATPMVEGSALFNPTFQVGNPATEASITGTVNITDAFVASNVADLKSNVLYLTANGERKRIQIDPSAIVTDVAQWVTALQNAVDGAFGTGKITVGGSNGNPISFTTVGTPDGELPSISAEYIRAKESELMFDIDSFITGLQTNDTVAINAFLGNVDIHLNRILSVRADIGARVNRMELVANRISENTTSFTKMLSDVQDADMGGVIMFLKNAENVYKAALSTGSKVIQPSLIDYLR